MKVSWDDGYSVDVPFGVDVVGMKERERRTIHVLLTPEEILHNRMPINQLYDYLTSLTNHVKL